MGSAVVKPLTRRRGKIKKNKVDVDPATCNEEENATSNCEPGVNCKVNIFSDSAKNSRQPFLGKPCKVKADKIESKCKVCCTYGFFSGRHKSYDSDEELCQNQQERKNKLGPSQIINSLDKETHLSENQSTIISSSQTLTCTDSLLPSQNPPSDKCKNITPILTASNSMLVPWACSCQKSIDKKENELDIKHIVNSDNKLVIRQKECAIDPNEADSAVGLYDQAEEVKMINLKKPCSIEPCSALPPLDLCRHSLETKAFSSRVDFSVSISKAEEPDKKSENVAFMNVSSKEYMVNEHGGAGEPAFEQSNSTKNGYLIKPIAKPHLCEELDYGKDDSNADNRCPSLREISPRSESGKSVKSAKIIKAQDDLSLECNENNAIHLTDSFGDVFKIQFQRSGSNRSSSTSLDNRGNVSKSGNANNSLLLNRPHVEDVLAVGEEFVDEITQHYFPQRNVHSPPPKFGNQLKPTFEGESNKSAQLLSPKRERNVGEKGTVESPRSSFDSSKSSDCSLYQQRILPESGRETLFRHGGSLHVLAHNNIYLGNNFLRPSSAANKPQSQGLIGVAPRYSLSIGGQIIQNDQSELRSLSVHDEILKDNKLSSIECSSKESLQSTGALHLQSSSNTNAQIQNLSNRSGTPSVTPDTTTINVVPNKCHSRPPSSKQSSSSLTSEQTRGRTRPVVCQQATYTPDPMQLIAKPPPGHSRQSSRPQSGLGRRTHSGLEVVGEEKEATRDTVVALARCHTINSSNSGSTLNIGSDDLLIVNDSDSVRLKLSRTSQTSAAISTTEFKASSPKNSCFSNGSHTHMKVETPVETGQVTSSLDHCCFLNEYDTSDHATPSLPPTPSVFSKRSVLDEQDEEYLENLIAPIEKTDPSEFCNFSKDAGTETETISNLTKTNNDEGLSDQAILDEQHCSVNSDVIVNIKKQLYEEGLKPAEREGGVAFFIPVTEDGLLPQIDGAVVAERLTKTKKSSLNYEERMFLANINRQVQLSKKKEFAVRDIRNVKGAASSSDGSDRTKQNDDIDEFDAPF